MPRLGAVGLRRYSRRDRIPIAYQRRTRGLDHCVDPDAPKGGEIRLFLPAPRKPSQNLADRRCQCQSGCTGVPTQLFDRLPASELFRRIRSPYTGTSCSPDGRFGTSLILGIAIASGRRGYGRAIVSGAKPARTVSINADTPMPVPEIASGIHVLQAVVPKSSP